MHVSMRYLLVFGLVSGAPAGTAAAAPVPVSPGEANALATVPACPTFSWVGWPAATGYELWVLPAEPAGSTAGAEPALRQRLPAGATTWTPPLERCLAPGERYAWLLRAQTQRGPTSWSELLLFRVRDDLSTAEAQEALALLRAWNEQGGDGAPVAFSTPPADTSSLLENSQADRPSETVVPEPTAVGAGGVTVALRGEVPDGVGETYGVRGVSNSPDGAGVRADNNNGSGGDVVLGGTPVAKLTESAFSRDSASNLSFDFTNPPSRSIPTPLAATTPPSASTRSPATSSASATPPSAGARSSSRPWTPTPRSATRHCLPTRRVSATWRWAQTHCAT